MRYRIGRSRAGFALLLSLLSWSSVPRAEERLQDAMTTEEFNRAGLQRLSADELSFLNHWLGRTTGRQTTPAFGAEQLRAFPPEEDPTQSVRTTVQGNFTGWSGRTVFRLANGQVWQQRLPGKYTYKARDPDVILKRGRFGYYLELVASGRQIPVKRLK